MPEETDITADFFRDLGANVKYNKNQYAHIVPSIAMGANSCKVSGNSARNCGGIDTIGDMWKWIMPTTPKAMLNNFNKYGSYYYVDTRPFMV